MPRSHSSSSDGQLDPNDEKEKHPKGNKKGKKTVSKRSHDGLSTSSPTSSSDEKGVPKGKSQITQPEADDVKKEKSLKNKPRKKDKDKKARNTLKKDEEPRKKKDESSNSKLSDVDSILTPDSDQLEGNDEVIDGNNSSLKSSDTKETSTSSSKSSNDTLEEQPKDESNETPPDTTSPAAPVQPLQGPYSISVVEKSGQTPVRGRKGTVPSKRNARGRVLKPTAKDVLREKISRRRPIRPRVEPPAKPPAETPSAPTTTTPETPPETDKTYELPERGIIKICPRDCWSARKTKYGDVSSEECSITLPARGVVFVANTGVDPCASMELCEHRMRRIQEHHMEKLGLKDIAYNWVVGGDLTVYEGLGWDRRSPAARNKHLQQDTGHDIYIGFIGKYIVEDVPIEMINTAVAFLYTNMDNNNIIENYEQDAFDELIIIDEEKYDILPYMR